MTLNRIGVVIEKTTFSLSQMSRTELARVMPWRENEGWNPTFSLSQMSRTELARVMPWRENEGWNPTSYHLSFSCGHLVASLHARAYYPRIIVFLLSHLSHHCPTAPKSTPQGGETRVKNSLFAVTRRIICGHTENHLRSHGESFAVTERINCCHTENDLLSHGEKVAFPPSFC